MSFFFFISIAVTSDLHWSPRESYFPHFFRFNLILALLWYGRTQFSLELPVPLVFFPDSLGLFQGLQQSLTFMFHDAFISLAIYLWYSSSFSLFFVFTLWSAASVKSNSWQVLFKNSSGLLKVSDLFLSQNVRELCMPHFWELVLRIISFVGLLCRLILCKRVSSWKEYSCWTTVLLLLWSESLWLFLASQNQNPALWLTFGKC